MMRWAWAPMSCSWVTSRMVLPWLCRRSKKFMISAEVCESRLPVGSSASRREGRLAQARGGGPPLAPSARQLVRPVVHAVGHIDRRQSLGGALAALRRRRAVVDERQLDVVERGLPRAEDKSLEDV